MRARAHAGYGITTLIGLIAFLLTITLAPTAAGGGDAPQDAPNRYIGAARCKNCHQAKESGDQYGVWEKQKHAKAFEELASDKAKQMGKEKGVADPQTSDKCLKCHTTAFGKPAAELHRSFDPKLGVQCETCHGPGEKHMKARMAAAAGADESKGKPAFTAIPDEEIVKNPGQKTCLGCHNEESPGFKPFCFHKFESTIRHLNPLKPRTDAEKAAMLNCNCGDKCACKNGCDDKCGAPAKAEAKK